jgi:hypothetical protein
MCVFVWLIDTNEFFRRVARCRWVWLCLDERMDKVNAALLQIVVPLPVDFFLNSEIDF